MNQYDFPYAPSGTHRNSDGLRARFARVDPNWNKRPARLEPRATAYARINHIEEAPDTQWGQTEWRAA